MVLGNGEKLKKCQKSSKIWGEKNGIVKKVLRFGEKKEGIRTKKRKEKNNFVVLPNQIVVKVLINRENAKKVLGFGEKVRVLRAVNTYFYIVILHKYWERRRNGL